MILDIISADQHKQTLCWSLSLKVKVQRMSTLFMRTIKCIAVCIIYFCYHLLPEVLAVKGILRLVWLSWGLGTTGVNITGLKTLEACSLKQQMPLGLAVRWTNLHFLQLSGEHYLTNCILSMWILELHQALCSSDASAYQGILDSCFYNFVERDGRCSLPVPTWLHTSVWASWRKVEIAINTPLKLVESLPRLL